jgi:hypothetical protein
MTTQQIYKGKYASERPTQEQVLLLQKMNVREEIIQSLDRKGAYELIRLIVARYYEAKFQAKHKPKFEIYVRW